MDQIIALPDIILLGIVGTVLWGAGKAASRVILDGKPPSGWRTWWVRTLPLHPIVAGACIGLVPTLPAPALLGGGAVGRVLWYALAGVLAHRLYVRVGRGLR